MAEDPYARFKDAGGDPWSRFSDAPKSAPEKPLGRGMARKVDAAVRGAADFLSFGFADEAEAALEAVPALARGTKAYGKAYEERLRGQRARDQADKREVPISRGFGQGAGFVGGLALGGLTNVGQVVPRIAPNAGRILRAAETTARNAFAGGAYGALAGAGASDQGIENRVKGAQSGGATGAALGAIAGPASTLVGAGLERTANAFAAPTRKVVQRLARISGDDVAAMQARAAEYNAFGIAPTLVDATDEAGRGVIRAAASRLTPGRQAAQDFANSRALDLPDRIGAQARRTMSQDPRTPAQIAAEVGERRRVQADAAFGAVRNEPVQPTDDMILALRTPAAKEAIGDAIQRERDPTVRAALARLQNNAFDNPAETGLTVGMADRVSRVLIGKAQAAARNGDNDLAMTLGSLGRAIRVPAANANAGYRKALDQYAAESRVLDAANRGEDLLRRNTDEFVADVATLSPEERAVALAAGRRAVERAAGESVASAPAVARRLATAPEQMARNRALMGPERAAAFQGGVAAEERALQNAQQIAPRSGSKTANQTQDSAQLVGAFEAGAKAVGNMARGDFLGVAADWLKSRGMSDAEAQALVAIATDPARLDQAFRILESRIGTQGARDFTSAVTRQVGARNSGENAVARGTP